jgi:hypothetical protein
MGEKKCYQSREKVAKPKVETGFSALFGEYIRITWNGFEIRLWEDGELSTPRNIKIQRDD